jgi:hypothetical protein
MTLSKMKKLHPILESIREKRMTLHVEDSLTLMLVDVTFLASLL